MAHLDYAMTRRDPMWRLTFIGRASTLDEASGADREDCRRRGIPVGGTDEMTKGSTRLGRRWALVAAASAAFPVLRSASAQSGRPAPLIGVLWNGDSPASEAVYMRALSVGLLEQGYVETQTIRVEHKFPAHKPERYRQMAAELVALRPDAILAVSPQSAIALKDATNSIPVVFTAVGDALRQGLVDNLARPGRNLTGYTLSSPELGPKRLQLLIETVPGIKKVGVLHQPSNPLDKFLLGELSGSAELLGLTLRLAPLDGSEASVRAAFALFKPEGIRAVIMPGGAVGVVSRHEIAREAIAGGMAVIQFTRDGSEAGSLLSYGSNIADVVRQSAAYVAKILKGAQPGDLPVVQPTKFEFIVNLRTARALGLTIPPPILARADEVIE